MILDRLVCDLASEGTVLGAGSDGAWQVTFRDEELRSAVPVIDLTEERLQACVRLSVADGLALWADVPGEEGAYRLLLVHVDEALATGAVRLRLRLRLQDHGGFTWDRHRDRRASTGELDDGHEYEWVARREAET